MLFRSLSLFFFCQLVHMEQKLEETLDTIMSKCRYAFVPEEYYSFECSLSMMLVSNQIIGTYYEFYLSNVHNLFSRKKVKLNEMLKCCFFHLTSISLTL